MKPEVIRNASIAESEAWYTGRDYMKGLLRTLAKAWQGMGIRKRIDDSLHFDERCWPCVAKEKRNSVAMLRALVHEMDA